MHINFARSQVTVMDQPTISIIIPSYNRAHLIGETLASVAAQTFQDYEIIVVDDGSKDNTPEIMQQWCQRDSRIRYVQQPNGGVSAARNTGIRLAQGEFIAFLDSDDLWRPWKLELQINLLRSLPQVGMLWTNMDTIDEQGKPLTPNYLRTMYSTYNGHGPEFPFQCSSPLTAVPVLKTTQLPLGVAADTVIRTGRILREMVYGNLVHTSTVVIRKSVADQVGLFNEDMRRAGEDYDYHLRTCALTEVAYLELSSMDYRIGMCDQITCPENNLYFAKSFLVSIEPFLKTPGLLSRSEQRQIRSAANLWLGEQLLEQGGRIETLQCLLKSWFYRPFQGETLKLILKACLPLQTIRKLRQAFRSDRSTVLAGKNELAMKS